MATQSEISDISQYAIISKIGQGGFSEVYRVKDIRTNEFYAAKVSNIMINEENQDSEETLLLFREINLMSLLDHPSIIKFIGYYSANFEGNPTPTIISELATNGSLGDVINLERIGISPDDWNDTKKLINIYGIAAGMSYLHSHNIIHRDLKPGNILIDDYLYPKIADFGLSKITDFLSINMNFQSQKGIKGTPAYMAPEILSEEKYSKASDVYAFAFILYEIVTNEIPFKKLTIYDILYKVMISGLRPQISENVPNAYRRLIEACWSQKPEERPTFESIIFELKNKKEFFTDLIDKSEFDNYVDFIDNYKATFDVANRAISFADFIKSTEQNTNIKAIDLKRVEEIKNYNEETRKSIRFNTENSESRNESFNFYTETFDDQKIGKIIEIERKDRKIIEIENIHEIMYPYSEFLELNIDCQQLVLEAEYKAKFQFIVGKSLFEGTNGFPKKEKLGLRYLSESVKRNYNDSIVYYSKILIKGEHILRDLKNADKYISRINSMQDKRFFSMKGKVFLKENKFAEAAKIFEEGVNGGDEECMYQYAKLIFIREVKQKSVKDAFEYLNNAKEHGHIKSEYFLSEFNKMNKIKSFSQLQNETQLFFITNNIKNMIRNQSKTGFDLVFLKPHQAEKMFYNKSLKSPIFHDFLMMYKSVTIEIEYPSTSFKSLIDLVTKIKNKKISKLEIGISFTSLQAPISKACFTKDISYHRISPPIQSIREEAFKNCTNMKKVIISYSVTKIEDNAFENCSSLTDITIPSSVNILENYLFQDCTSLKQVKLPSEVSILSNGIFFNCSSLAQVSLPSNMTKCGHRMFQGCKSLTEIIIPSSSTVIDYFCFGECKSLKKIVIPASITFLGAQAFTNCSSLTDVYILSQLTDIKYSVFEGCSSLKNINIPYSVTEINKKAFLNCTSLSEITVPSSLLKIDEEVFKECSSLVKISDLSSVQEISSGAFQDCSSLKKITIPSSLTKISEYTFSGCSSLTEIAIPSSVTSIGEGAFSRCSSLTDVSIPYAVKIIEDEVFNECSSLVKVTLHPSITSIGNKSFFGCSSLQQITIPDYVKTIGKNAFGRCSSLTKFVIPSSVSKIGKDAFVDCSSLTEIEIPSSLKKQLGKIGKNVKVKTK